MFYLSACTLIAPLDYKWEVGKVQIYGWVFFIGIHRCDILLAEPGAISQSELSARELGVIQQ